MFARLNFKRIFLERVVIVGAGPAGLFTAYELVKTGEFDISIVEEKPVAGGEGLNSDGKLNYHPKIGGDLTKFVSWDAAEDLMREVEQVFRIYGANNYVSFNEEKLDEIDRKANSSGLEFWRYTTVHIGTDYLPEVVGGIKNYLENVGVKFVFNTTAESLIQNNGRIKSIKTRAIKESGLSGELSADFFVLAPGRSGADWMRKIAEELFIETKFNPVDIGVRLEAPNEIATDVVKYGGCLDAKFYLTTSLKDMVRTFCVCYGGYVVRDHYYNGLVGVNGFSNRDKQTPFTNLALLETIGLKDPDEDTTIYAELKVQQLNHAGGGKPIIQRLQDLKNGKRSYIEDIKKSEIKPTLNSVTPGNIGRSYDYTLIRNILEAIERLDAVMPGINNGNSILVYAPEFKAYAREVVTDSYLRVPKYPNLYAVGDGAGKSRGITGAAALGILAARGIIDASS